MTPQFMGIGVGTMDGIRPYEAGYRVEWDEKRLARRDGIVLEHTHVVATQLLSEPPLIR